MSRLYSLKDEERSMFGGFSHVATFFFADGDFTNIATTRDIYSMNYGDLVRDGGILTKTTFTGTVPTVQLGTSVTAGALTGATVAIPAQGAWVPGLGPGATDGKAESFVSGKKVRLTFSADPSTITAGELLAFFTLTRGAEYIGASTGLPFGRVNL